MFWSNTTRSLQHYKNIVKFSKHFGNLVIFQCNISTIFYKYLCTMWVLSLPTLHFVLFLQKCTCSVIQRLMMRSHAIKKELGDFCYSLYTKLNVCTMSMYVCTALKGNEFTFYRSSTHTHAYTHFHLCLSLVHLNELLPSRDNVLVVNTRLYYKRVSIHEGLTGQGD